MNKLIRAALSALLCCMMFALPAFAVAETPNDILQVVL